MEDEMCKLRLLPKCHHVRVNKPIPTPFHIKRGTVKYSIPHDNITKVLSKRNNLLIRCI